MTIQIILKTPRSHPWSTPQGPCRPLTQGQTCAFHISAVMMNISTNTPRRPAWNTLDHLMQYRPTRHQSSIMMSHPERNTHWHDADRVLITPRGPWVGTTKPPSGRRLLPRRWRCRPPGTWGWTGRRAAPPTGSGAESDTAPWCCTPSLRRPLRTDLRVPTYLRIYCTASDLPHRGPAGRDDASADAIDFQMAVRCQDNIKTSVHCGGFSRRCDEWEPISDVLVAEKVDGAKRDRAKAYCRLKIAKGQPT